MYKDFFVPHILLSNHESLALSYSQHFLLRIFFTCSTQSMKNENEVVICEREVKDIHTLYTILGCLICIDTGLFYDGRRGEDEFGKVHAKDIVFSQ